MRFKAFDIIHLFLFLFFFNLFYLFCIWRYFVSDTRDIPGCPTARSPMRAAWWPLSDRPLIGFSSFRRLFAGGFQLFSAKYHFMRTQKMIYMPRELEVFMTYPVEIIPGLLYLGNEIQGNDLAVQKALKVRERRGRSQSQRVRMELVNFTAELSG